MGRTGPKPARSDSCHITAKGHLRGNFNGRLRLQHDVVWEQANGPIPSGYCIHHINGDKLDNRIENLQLVTNTEHKRIHGGCELRDGQWWKPCHVCGELKPITEEYWYISREGWPLYGRCRPCHIAQVVADKRMRRLRRTS